jgi:Cyclin, N-terminal domain
MGGKRKKLGLKDTHEPKDLTHVSIIISQFQQQMVEWMYRVADHFNEDREIVAMGQSALDRFVSKCSCDRSAFKLAAMTTLYICSKTNGVWTFDNHHPHYPHHRPSLTVQSLAELSRGEFDVQHITEMEMIVLQTLGWRVNPPTIQSFIHSFYFYLPVLRSTAATAGSPSSLSSHHQQNMIASAILNRAVFFAELAVYDHAFVRTERALLALSALLNAMEGMDEASVPAQQQDCLLETIANTFGLTYARDVIEDCRNRLWFVYSMSAQYRDEDPSSSTSSSSTSSYSSPDSQHCVDCNNSKNTANTVVLKQQQQAADQLGAANNNNNTSGGLSSSPVSVVVSPIHQ